MSYTLPVFLAHAIKMENEAADFRWIILPEVADDEAFDYTLDPFHALQFARVNEQRAAEFLSVGWR